MNNEWQDPTAQVKYHGKQTKKNCKRGITLERSADKTTGDLNYFYSIETLLLIPIEFSIANILSNLRKDV